MDLHGAPGGQTGANIDDCVDDFPRLFTDRDSWDKALALWGELARRYRDRWIVGGYDLLNEPLRPDDGRRPCQYLLPRLRDFYIEAIAEIHRHDQKAWGERREHPGVVRGPVPAGSEAGGGL